LVLDEVSYFIFKYFFVSFQLVDDDIFRLLDNPTDGGGGHQLLLVEVGQVDVARLQGLDSFPELD